MRVDGNFKDRLIFALKGESTHSFSKRAGISNTVMRRYLSGDSVPGLDNLNSIAESTGFSVQWLATGKEPTYSESFAERLGQIAKTVGDVDKLAEQANIDLDDMLDYMDGMRTPQAASVVQIARVAGVSLEWLLTGEGQQTANNSSSGGQYEEIAKRFDINTSDLFSYTMIGDHMHSTVRNNESVICSNAAQHKAIGDGIYIINIDGEEQIRRLQRVPGNKVRILCDNPAYAAFDIEKDDLIIVGKALCISAREL